VTAKGVSFVRDDKGSPAPGEADEAAIFQIIKEFLEQNAGAAFAQPVELGTPLLNSSLDSFTVLQLMMFLSERLQFELQEEDFVEEHFGTVGALVRRIVAKRGTS
jgi:acyl carrier protein